VSKNDDIKKGEQIVKAMALKHTLAMINVGSKQEHFELLQMLPTDISTIEERFKTSLMTANRRVNALEKVGLLERERQTGKVMPNKVTKEFLNLILNLREDVIKTLAEIIPENPV